MGNFVIKDTKIEVSYSYTDANVIVNGIYHKGNANSVIDVTGSVFHKQGNEQGTYIGNFTGTMDNNGVLKYNISQVELQDMINVQTAIAAIDQELNKENEGEGE